jgi:signal transduction histidine kinase
VGVGPWLVLVGALGFTALMAVYFGARVSAEDRLRKARDQLTRANHNLAAKTTELEASLSELGNARAQLMQEEALKSVGRLAAGIAHEINTPVQFVSDSIFFARDATESLATLIQRYQEAHRSLAEGGSWKEVAAAMTKAEEEADLHYILEKLPRAIARSLDGIERVTSIVRSMKEFAHPDQKEMAAVDLNHSIESTLTMARNEYKYVAEVKTDFGELPMVTCYAGVLNQAILNIVVNAAHAIEDVVKTTGGRGTIDVRTRREGDNVLISIGDTGGGIPREIWSRVFDPFFTTKEVGRGTGQGLAIARSVVVEKHGGDLRFETEPGKGTTFFIRLPIAGQKGPAPEGKG